MEFNWIRRSEDVSRVNKFSIHDVAEAWCVWASQDEWCTIFTIQVRGGGAFRACVGPPGLLMFVWAIQPYNMLLRRLVQLTTPQSHHWSNVNVHRSLPLPTRSEVNYDCTFFTETSIIVVIHHLRLLTLVYGFNRFLRARLSLVCIRLFDGDVVWLRLDVCYAVAFLFLLSHQRQKQLRSFMEKRYHREQMVVSPFGIELVTFCLWGGSDRNELPERPNIGSILCRRFVSP